MMLVLSYYCSKWISCSVLWPPMNQYSKSNRKAENISIKQRKSKSFITYAEYATTDNITDITMLPQWPWDSLGNHFKTLKLPFIIIYPHIIYIIITRSLHRNRMNLSKLTFSRSRYHVEQHTSLPNCHIIYILWIRQDVHIRLLSSIRHWRRSKEANPPSPSQQAAAGARPLQALLLLLNKEEEVKANTNSVPNRFILDDRLTSNYLL